MKIAICDLCYCDGKKIAESKYRWGFKGGFKLDLCAFHADKKNNPLGGMKQEAAEALYFKMRYGRTEQTEEDLKARLEHAGDNVAPIRHGGRP